MKSLTKRIGVLALVFALATAIIACSGLFVKSSADVAVAEDDAAHGYFYGQLKNDVRAQAFYKAFEALESSGAFKNGKVEYDIVANNVVSVDDVAAYVGTGNTKVPKAFGAGRDTFFMDHPDLFYVDVFSTSISAGSMDNSYVAFLDTSRATTLYRGSINTKSAVETAIAAYEAKLTEVVNGAKAAGGVKEQIEYVNKYICENVEYSYGTVVEVKDGKTLNVDTPAAAYIHTAYGALVNGKAVCEGYSMAFKSVMDRLDVPCVSVLGYASSDGANYNPHMWNYVELDGMWYAVDTTWNATGKDSTEWLLIGANKMSGSHIEDYEASTSGYKLKYPAVKPYEYGNDTDDNGMYISGTYTDFVYDEETGEKGRKLVLDVSFEGKGAAVLEKEGKYFAYRMGYKMDEEIVWLPWFSVTMDEVFGGFFTDSEDGVKFQLDTNVEYIQFALIDYAPDDARGATYPSYHQNAGKPYYYAYNEENLTDEHFIGAISTPYLNNGYGTFVAAPAAMATPSNSAPLPVDKTYEIKLTYNEKLELVEGKTEDEIGMDFWISRGNDEKDNATVSNVKWDGNNVVTFTLKPSKMYIHNKAWYYLTPTNLVGVDSKKVPEPVMYSFAGEEIICNKMLPGGRLYMSIYGAPNILDTSDLSVTNFQDEQGNYFAESQRSQLLLVASKPDEEKVQNMKDMLLDETEIAAEDIMSSSTYEINLQICGVIPKIPNDSFVRVSFGFPEGYNPEVEGTTFKIYHYKSDSKGNIIGIEEIPVIINQYGIIAQVDSFSPFIVVELKNTSAEVVNSSNKNIYAAVNGNGGSITNSGINTVSNDGITYNITAEEGYQIGNVALNGKVLDKSRYENGELHLSKDEIGQDNMLEVNFVTKESVESYEARGIDIVVAVASAGASESSNQPSTTPSEPNTNTGNTPNNSNVGVIVGCVVAAVVVVALAVGLAIFFTKKRAKSRK
ncbi:MAG: hypothetical protein K2J16_00910 [Clostridia bacterium]|nr:hypothetical protein [Clostridia bacterium]